MTDDAEDDACGAAHVSPSEPRGAAVRVPAALDMFGNPAGFIDAEPEAAGQWDTTRWRSSPSP